MRFMRNVHLRPLWRWSLLGVAALYCGWRTWLVESHTLAQDSPLRFESLEDRVDATVREFGSLETADSLEIRSRVPGTTKLLSILPDGSTVKRGDLVAQLDDSQYREQLAQQKIALAAAEADRKRAELTVSLASSAQDRELKIVELRTGLARQRHQAFADRTDELGLKIRQLERTERIEQLRLDTAQRTLTLVEQAQQAQDPARIRPEQAKLAVQEAMAQLENAQMELDFLRKSQQELRGAELKLQLLEAETALDRKKVELTSAYQAAVAELKAAEQKLTVEQERLAQLENHIAACAVTAPRDGVIVHANVNNRRVNATIEAGADVRERQPLVKMPRLDQLRVRVQVHESRISRVQPGQPATIRFDALPQKQFTGKVLETSSIPAPTTFPNLDVREYPVLVSLDDQNPALRIGMTCVVEIVTRDD